MKILTEKVTVGDVRCRKITGFEGFEKIDDLPASFLSSRPDVHACVVSVNREFDGKRIRLGEIFRGLDFKVPNGISFEIPAGSEKPIDMGECSNMICVGAVIPEATFQNILYWIGKAKQRLDYIRNTEIIEVEI